MKKIIAIMMSFVYIATIAFAGSVKVSAKDDFVKSWSAVVSGDYLVFTVKANNKQDWGGYDSKFNAYPLNIETDNDNYTLTITWGASEIKGNNYQDINGASISHVDEDYGQKVTAKIPLSYFNDPSSLTVKYNDEDKTIKVKSEEVTEAPATEAPKTEEEKTTEATEAEVTEAESTEASTETDSTESDVTEDETTPEVSDYSKGIVIDGDFSDWDSIAKVDFVGTKTGTNNVIKSAIVFDGDLYIYLQDNSGYGGAAWSGPNNNGKYSIVSNATGKQVIFKLNNDGSASGIDGIESTRTGTEWEIKIPAAELPKNNGSVSFGYYLGEPTFSDVKDIQAKEINDVGEITYDYSYSDWEWFPHSVIEYDTAGTSQRIVDSHAAIHLADNEVLGHVETNHPRHINSGGGDLLFGVHTIVNNNYDMEWRVAAVDSAGNINWEPQRENLPNGTYEFYIFDTGCWGKSANINNLNDHDICFGKTYLTLTDESAEMEWSIDSETLAKFFGLDATDLRVVGSVYKRIGDEVIDTAGVSTGGLPAALGCVIFAYGLSKIAARRKRREDAVE